MRDCFVCGCKRARNIFKWQQRSLNTQRGTKEHLFYTHPYIYIYIYIRGRQAVFLVFFLYIPLPFSLYPTLSPAVSGDGKETTREDKADSCGQIMPSCAMADMSAREGVREREKAVASASSVTLCASKTRRHARRQKRNRRRELE